MRSTSSTFVILLGLMMLDGAVAMPPVKCEPLRIAWCLGFYDSVHLPNHLGQHTQEEAYYSMQKLWPLIQLRCSGQLLHYICRLYAPQCPMDMDSNEFVHFRPERLQPPCEDVCFQVRRDCEAVLREHRVQWPDELDCVRLHNASCMETPAPHYHEVITTAPEVTTPPDIKDQTDFAATPTADPFDQPSSLSSSSPDDGNELPNVDSTGVFSEGTPEPSPEPEPSSSPDTTDQQQTDATPEPEDGDTSSAEPVATGSSDSMLGITPVIEETATGAATSDETGKSDDEFEQREPGGNSVQCEWLAVPMCQSLAYYNATRTPNLVGHTSQAEAVVALRYFFPLMLAKCSRLLSSFLCRAYAPPCHAPIPCGRACRRVQTECQQLIDKLGLFWPTSLDCDRFPDDVDCWDPGDDDIDQHHQDRQSHRLPPDPDTQPGDDDQVCYPLSVDFCLNLNYDDTVIESGQQKEYLPKGVHVWDRCHPQFRFVACTVYLPPCHRSYPAENLLPTNRLCRSVRDACLESNVGADWPEELDCDRFLDPEEEPEEPAETRWPFPAAFKDDDQNLVQHPAEMVRQNQQQPLADGLQSSSSSSSMSDAKHCEFFSIDLCSILPYNRSGFPNVFNHSNVPEAKLELYQFELLIDANCSPRTRQFLCRAFLPPCEPIDRLPYRQECLTVMRDCYPLLRMHGLDWPKLLHCQRFPPCVNCTGGGSAMDKSSSSVSSTPQSTVAVLSDDVIVTEADTDDPATSRRQAIEYLLKTASLNHRCQPVTAMRECRRYYKLTQFPNVLHHQKQHEAGVEFAQFRSALMSNCSADLGLFLCLIYSPVCTVLDDYLPPCRSLCTAVRRDCEPIMSDKLRFNWPPYLDCRQFRDDRPCVSAISQTSALRQTRDDVIGQKSSPFPVASSDESSPSSTPEPGVNADNDQLATNGTSGDATAAQYKPESGTISTLRSATFDKVVVSLLVTMLLSAAIWRPQGATFV